MKDFKIRIYEDDTFPASPDDKIQWGVMQPAIDEAYGHLANATGRASIRKMALCMGLAANKLNEALDAARKHDTEICELLDKKTK